MTAFLWVCVAYFIMSACLDLADLRRRNTPVDWLLLVFNTGMLVFAANALWESY